MSFERGWEWKTRKQRQRKRKEMESREKWKVKMCTIKAKQGGKAKRKPEG
jgi:hypothetical protein